MLRTVRFGILSLVIEPMTAQTEDAKDHARWAALQRKVQAQRVAKVFKLFRDNDIEPVLIKGFACDQYYPIDVYRESIDIDLAVAADDLQRANRLILSGAAEGLAIDLHNELRHLDTVAWPDLFANSQLIDLGDTTARVLRAEDHLRVLCVHWLNDGGVNKARLWDIYYLIADRRSDFDWARALDAAGERRRRWIACTILLAKKYLGLDLAGTPLEHETAIPTWLTRTVEHEWAHHQAEVPLWIVIREPARFLKQAALRVNPNPVRATVEMEGNFDARTRIFYKIGNLFQRLVPSIRRNLSSATDR